jgi:MoaA/NifB/PqqE/SkfB family radical SAM enzyme
VFAAAAAFRARGARLHLLTSGIALERFAAPVAEHFERVTVSLDGSTEASYQAVRGVAALGAVERGVASLRRTAPQVPVTARATLHRRNFRELPRLISQARHMGVDRISFLAADVSSSAFGRREPPDERLLRLSSVEAGEFAALVEDTLIRFRGDFESGFVAESPAALRRLPQYYAAINGHEPFPRVSCNAPWMSVVVEANGTVRPCFFHEGIGNVRERDLTSIVTEHLPLFRRGLDVATNPICRRCVCSIRAGWRNAPWQ